MVQVGGGMEGFHGGQGECLMVGITKVDSMVESMAEIKAML
jgi:hypothetical protein